MYRHFSLLSKLPCLHSSSSIIPKTLAFSLLPSPKTPAQPFPINATFKIPNYSTMSLMSLNDLRQQGGEEEKKEVGPRYRIRQGEDGGSRAEGEGDRDHEVRLRRRPDSVATATTQEGFQNRFSLTFQPVGLGKIARLINAGHIDSSELITMKTLKETGAIGKQIKDGVRLMGRGAELIQWPIHIEVSRATLRAKAAVETLGGSVRKVFYNKLGLRALIKPEWFAKKRRLLPKPARPPPKQADRVDSIGRLPAPTKPIPFEPDVKQPTAVQAQS